PRPWVVASFGADGCVHDGPALPDLADRLAPLIGDVDPDFPHRADGERVDRRGFRAGALYGKAIARVRPEKAFGHLGARGGVGAEEEDALHALKHGGGAELVLSAATKVTVRAWLDDGQDVQEGPRVRARAPKDLRTGVEDQNEDDEDEQDDPDDHSGAKSTVVRHDRPTRGVHVDLAHLEPPRAKSVVPLASSVPRQVARSYARPVCGSARSVFR